MSLEDDTAHTGNGEGAQKGTEAGGEDAVALMRKLITALEKTEKTGNSRVSTLSVLSTQLGVNSYLIGTHSVSPSRQGSGRRAQRIGSGKPGLTVPNEQGPPSCGGGDCPVRMLEKQIRGVA